MVIRLTQPKTIISVEMNFCKNCMPCLTGGKVFVKHKLSATVRNVPVDKYFTKEYLIKVEAFPWHSRIPKTIEM